MKTFFQFNLLMAQKLLSLSSALRVNSRLIPIIAAGILAVCATASATPKASAATRAPAANEELLDIGQLWVRLKAYDNSLLQLKNENAEIKRELASLKKQIAEKAVQ